MRVYLKIIFGNSLANSVSSKIGFLKHCQNCKHRRVENLKEQDLVCEMCGTKCNLAGPLWIDSLFGSEFVGAMLKELKKNKNYSSSSNDYDRLLKVVRTCDTELPYASYFDTDSIASMAKKSSVSLDRVLSTLAGNGFNVSRTIMNDKGFKTDASPKEIINLLYK
jgi:tRNA (guanine26-N2/guanine27-N2)-dimethyltransferase